MSKSHPISRAHRLEDCVALLGIFLLGLGHLQNTIWGYPLWRLGTLLPPFYLLLVGLLLLRWQRALLAVKLSPSTWILVLLAVVSTLWSASPDSTLEQAGMLAGTTLFGLYLAVAFRTRTLLRLLAIGAGVLLVANLALDLLSPDQALLGTSLQDGKWQWQGIFKHKNTLGIYSVLAVLVFDLSRRHGVMPSGPAWAGLIAGLATAAVSGSRTAMALTAVCVLATPVARAAGRLNATWRVILASVVGAVGLALVVTRWDSFTLTGRVALWDLLMSSIRQRPWLGFGYEAFWSIDGPAQEVYRTLMDRMVRTWPGHNTLWYPRHAHNGFVHLTLELGFVGLVLFCAGLGRSLRRSLRWLAAGRGLGAEWALFYLAVLMLVYNMVETTIMAPNNLFWSLYAAAVHGLSAPRLAAATQPARLGPTFAQVIGALILIAATGLGGHRFIAAQLWALATSRNETGRRLTAEGRPDQAVDSLRSAASLRPEWYVPHVNLGLAYEQMERDSLALDHYDKAVLDDKDSGEALSYRGDFFVDQRRFEAARRDLEESMDRGTVGLRTYAALATAYAGLGEADPCLRYTRMFIQAGGDLGAIVSISDPFFQGDSNLSPGLEYFQKLNREYPDRWWIFHNIGTLAKRLGQPELARDAYARAEELREASGQR